MASSSVFQFSQLLPRKFCLFHKTTKPRMNKAIMTDYEDRLIISFCALNRIFDQVFLIYYLHSVIIVMSL